MGFCQVNLSLCHSSLQVLEDALDPLVYYVVWRKSDGAVSQVQTFECNQISCKPNNSHLTAMFVAFQHSVDQSRIYKTYLDNEQSSKMSCMFSCLLCGSDWIDFFLLWGRDSD